MENVKEIIHEIIDHLDLSPAHRISLHGRTDDPEYDPAGEAPADAASADATPAEPTAPALTDRQTKIAALKAQLAEQAEDEEIAALQAQLAKATPAPAETATDPEGA